MKYFTLMSLLVVALKAENYFCTHLPYQGDLHFIIKTISKTRLSEQIFINGKPTGKPYFYKKSENKEHLSKSENFYESEDKTECSTIEILPNNNVVFEDSKCKLIEVECYSF